VTRADQDPTGALVPIARIAPMVPDRKIVEAVAVASAKIADQADRVVQRGPELLVPKAEGIAMTEAIAEDHVMTATADRNRRPSR